MEPPESGTTCTWIKKDWVGVVCYIGEYYVGRMLHSLTKPLIELLWKTATENVYLAVSSSSQTQSRVASYAWLI